MWGALLVCAGLDLGQNFEGGVYGSENQGETAQIRSLVGFY